MSQISKMLTDMLSVGTIEYWCWFVEWPVSFLRNNLCPRELLYSITYICFYIHRLYWVPGNTDLISWNGRFAGWITYIFPNITHFYCGITDEKKWTSLHAPSVPMVFDHLVQDENFAKWKKEIFRIFTINTKLNKKRKDKKNPPKTV